MPVPSSPQDFSYEAITNGHIAMAKWSPVSSNELQQAELPKLRVLTVPSA